jgi:hypothetical protein
MDGACKVKNPRCLILAILVFSAVNGDPLDNGKQQSGRVSQDPGYEAVAHYFKGDDIYQAGTPLGQLDLVLAGDQDNVVCTAFAIRPNLVATAKHCLHPKDIATGYVITDDDVITIKFLIGRIAIQDREQTVRLKRPPLVMGKTAADFDDYVVFETESPLSPDLKYPLAGGIPGPWKKLSVYHYPDLSQQLQVSNSHCRAFEQPIDGAYLRHQCITKDGSSGAPIFDEHYNIVGLNIQGGYDPKAETSYGVGILISEIMKNADLPKDAFRDNRGRVSPSLPSSSVDKAIAVESGSRLIMDGAGAWFVERSQATGARRVPLIPQISPPSVLKLWDNERDITYTIPKRGGAVKAQHGSSQDIATVGTAPTG